MKGGVEVIFGSCWKVEEEARELGQAGTLAYSNCYRERKKKSTEKKRDAAALASYFLPRMEERPFKVIE